MTAARGSSLAALTGWGVAGLLALVALGQCVGSNNNSFAPTGTPTPLATRFVTPRSLNCRSEPSPGASTVRGLARGDAVSIAEEKDGWARVDGDNLCWVSAAFLSDGQPSGVSIGTTPAVGAAAAAGSRLASSSGSKGSSSQGMSGSVGRQSFYSAGRSSSSKAEYSSRKRSKKARKSRTGRKTRYYDAGSGCPCSGGRVCIGPRGGRYCITSGGNKRYGV